MAQTTKADIKTAALNLFIKQGYEPTTIRDITSSLDITPAALYYHFESKDALLMAVAEPLFAASRALLDLVEPLTLNLRTARVALSAYYDTLKDPWLTRVMVDDPAIRNHSGIAKLWQSDAVKFMAFLAGDGGTLGRVRATAAMGTIRRSLELPNIDPAKDRDTIIGVALANLKLGGPSRSAMDDRNRDLEGRLARVRAVRDELNSLVAEAEEHLQIYSAQ